MQNTKSSPLENLEATLLYKQLNTAGPEAIKAPNEVGVAHFVGLVQEATKEKESRDGVFAVIIFSGIILALVLVWKFLGLGIFLLYFSTMAIVVACYGDEKYKKLPALRDAIRPLVDLKKCERALSLADSHEACADYRQQVLGYGREFRELDLMLMEELAAHETQKQEAVQAQQRCQQLHGIAA